MRIERIDARVAIEERLASPETYDTEPRIHTSAAGPNGATSYLNFMITSGITVTLSP